MSTIRDMIHEDDPRSLIGMVIFMLIGQLLMVTGEFAEGIKTNVYLFNILDLDKYLVMMVHLLSAISFLITIVVGIPKAMKSLKGMRKRKDQKDE